jgi:ATP-dependent RNA helicase DeaD
MVRLGLSKGKAHGIRPNDVVGTIAFHADIPGNSIGKIKIQQQNSFVDVPEKYVDQVLANAPAMKIHRQFIDLKRL